VVNAKRTAAIHRLRSRYELAARTITVWLEQDDRAPITFHLDADRSALATWLSEYFGYAVTLRQNLHMGFPDDTDASGPTVVSVATLETIASWFPEFTLAEVRRRFRTNLDAADRPYPFQIGTVSLLGNNPCQRCVVPTRDPQTGVPYPRFQKEFTVQRQATLPKLAPPSRFNHFFKLTLNTKMPASEAGKVLRVGDAIGISTSD
jgi:uncharacterized protein